MLKYATPICLVVFLLVNLASIAPPMRRMRGGRRVLTPAGWVLYLVLNFSAFMLLAFAALLGPPERRLDILWLAGVFGFIAAARIGVELSLIAFLVYRSGENLERNLMLEQKMEQLYRRFESRPQRPPVPETEEALDPELLLKDSSAKIPVELLKKDIEAAENAEPDKTEPAGNENNEKNEVSE